MEISNLTTNAHPDRYSLLLLSPAEIQSRIDACVLLGMTWVLEDYPGSTKVAMHIFFDQAGKKKYLNGEWP